MNNRRLARVQKQHAAGNLENEKKGGIRSKPPKYASASVPAPRGGKHLSRNVPVQPRIDACQVLGDRHLVAVLHHDAQILALHPAAVELDHVLVAEPDERVDLLEENVHLASRGKLRRNIWMD